MSGPSPNQQKRNQQRRLAVQLRLDGLTLVETTRQSGLSAPTVIAAHKAYLAGGWDAVQVKPRGRPSGNRLLSQERQTELCGSLQASRPEETDPQAHFWSYSLANKWLKHQGHSITDRSASAYFELWDLHAPHPIDALKQSETDQVRSWLAHDYPAIIDQARSDGVKMFWVGVSPRYGFTLFHAHNSRRKFSWLCSPNTEETADACIDFFNRLLLESAGPIVIVLQGIDIARVSRIQQWLSEHAGRCTLVYPPSSRAGSPSPNITGNQTESSAANTMANTPSDTKTTLKPEVKMTTNDNTLKTDTTANQPPTQPGASLSPVRLTHLQRLEAESIHIMREVVAEADNPVMMYSVGKDSAVMLHLAMKAFYPAKPPFPLLHVDTTWKFRAMYELRDRIVDDYGLELLTHVNPDGLAQKVNPFTHGSALHTDIMKTEGLKQALDKHQFDVAFGGARRDEERSRAKERIFSFRSAQHRWEPKSQRPELWNLYNARKQKGESIRVFPISNWTELDVWQYIHLEGIPIVPLYYAAERPVVERDGTLIMVDDDRMPLHPGEVPMMRNVRFRTLGCYPLTGAVESTATTLPEIIQEMLLTRTSERQGRMIDHDNTASMEKKKQEGYF